VDISINYAAASVEGRRRRVLNYFLARGRDEYGRGDEGDERDESESPKIPVIAR